MKKRKKFNARKNANAGQGALQRRAARELFLRAIRVGDLPAVKKLLPHVDPMQDDGIALLLAFDSGHDDIFRFIYASVDDDQVYWNIMLCAMARFGRCSPEINLKKVVEERGGAVKLAYQNAADDFDFVLAMARTSAWSYYALRCAAEHGNLDFLQRLLPLSDARCGDSGALRVAAKNGHTEVVRALIPACDPKAAQSDALVWAAGSGHLDTVDVLLPVSDAKAQGSLAIAQAALANHAAIVDRLWKVSDPTRALKLMESNGNGRSLGAALIRDRLSAERQHATLVKSTCAVEKRASPSARRGRL